MIGDEDFSDAERAFAAGFTAPYTSRDLSSEALGAHIVDWYTLPDATAASEWEALRLWVEWVSVRYNIPQTVIPLCWYQHGALVEELSALHTAHRAAFDRSDAGYGPVGWHERAAIALPRLAKAYGGGCNNGHQPTKPRTWPQPRAEWDAWTSQAHAHRDTHTGDSQRKETHP
ncbi:hypothetical protein ACFUTX_16390 [Microbacterium sp. NPDC057407]|uniref:hypothetical protein n=1 Tax=Microbacterium sp. NPDC057407 TaxID=3346120 RepID=UPI00366B7D14